MDQIKPASKRESEINFLGKLLSEYSSQDVALAVTHVRKFGVLGSREECHSPLKYLSSAIEQVLPKARQHQALMDHTADHPKPSEAGLEHSDSDSAGNRLRTIALAAFESELSDEEQSRYLAEVTKENSVSGYAPPVSVLRGVAAMKLFEWREVNKSRE